MYRLRGRLGGAEQIFDLGLGEHLAGSSRTCAVILPDASISRRHARLTVTAQGLTVEDLGSTNGTRVDGVNVRLGTVPAGAELSLGSVRLAVEAIDGDDARLAIVLERPDRALRPTTLLGGAALELSTLVFPTTASAQGLDTVERLVRLLPARGGAGELGPALAGLGESLQCAGCAAVEWSGESAPVVAAGWGRIGALPTAAELRRTAREKRIPAADAACVLFVPGELPLALAVGAPEGGRLQGLALWGDFPGRTASAPLLRTLAACIARWAPTPAASTGTEPSPPRAELVFPRGYRPGTSAAMAALYEQMQGLIAGDLPILIHGETGVGKEIVAHVLHASSPRRHGPFVAINCAAIPRDLLEAELFGVERGVATGVDPRSGKFELARGGTLFLDEIGEMAPELQAKLLRALQEKEIQPLGGRPKPFDARILSATLVDLAREEGGNVRPDLFYRLAGFLLEVPPLRQCPEDIPGLIEHFLRRFSAESGKPVRGLTIAALRILSAFPWPGNVRQLENEARHLVYAASEDGVIREEALSSRLRREPVPAAGELERLASAAPSLILEPAVRELEAAWAGEALRRAGGRRTEASRLLGLSRNGLYKKMRQLGLEKADAQADEPG
jgi:DNA-binding NtrC family response regulator